MKSMKLAVIGKDVSGSVSPQIHNFIADCLGRKITYDKISIPEDKFGSRIGEIIGEYDGFNVTIPFKLPIIPHLKSLEGDAEVFGAVNTVTTRDLRGYNTDGLGFMMMLENNGVGVRGQRALVLGAGGAGRSVCKKLIDGGAAVSVYDSSFEKAEDVARKFGATPLECLELGHYDIVVNATGVGMHNTVGVSPAKSEVLVYSSAAVDLIYNPKKSKFLELAEEFGIKALNGEGMLFYQAYYAQCIFFGAEPNFAEANILFGEYVRSH